MKLTAPRIAVLLSSYNGSAYIEEQLLSILNQTGVLVSVFVRDDGSTDKTLQILNKFEDAGSIYLFAEDNIGVTNSFFRLLELAGSDYEFYAFADQDDVWKADKLLRACTRLGEEAKSTPGMFYSRLEFVDQKLRHLGYSTIPTTRGFSNALVQNQATGCTVVLNRFARDLVCERIPPWCLMHDWWCYLVISAFGKVFYDEHPAILYRKHGNNVTPATPYFILELYARTRRFLGENDIPEKVSDQARLFFELYGERLAEDKRHLIQTFLKIRKEGILGRLSYAIRMPVRRNTPFDNLIMRILFVIGRF
ncbi:MAG: glycosyltransferase family 2 protein [Bacteroidetes bacterium]|nr:glycosyltransferase family 2 protein [Bacteroidota bacterium]MCH8523461.1 glycosyltransferase family 2 protein [Balneolales bacterium]